MMAKTKIKPATEVESATAAQPLSGKDKMLIMAKACELTAKVLYILAIVGCLVFTVLAIVLPLTGVMHNHQPAEVALIFGVLALYFFMGINVLWNAKQIFQSVRIHQTPFHERVTHYLQKTAVAIILISFIPALIGSILIHILAPESTVRFDFQYVGLIMGVITLMLEYIFDYGIELQKKDDETL